MSDVILKRDHGVLEITLHRPEAMNAMSAEMIELALNAFSDLVRDGTERAVLMTGSGRGFCAGADLSGGRLESARDGIEDQMLSGINRLIQAVREVPVPVVVALNGPAAGAGCGLALAADITVAARSASLLTAFSRIGAVLDGGLSWTLPQKIGPARAMGMAMLGDEPIPSETARDWGLIWDVVDDDQLMPEARQLARRLAAGPSVALSLIKRQIGAAQNASLADSLRFEAACQGEAFRTEDFVEGVRAYQEKRPADFKGR